MRVRLLAVTLFAALMSGGSASASWSGPQQPKKDYLTETEADKIRDAMLPPERIKLFVSFAEDRLKKFQYELARATPEGRRSEILNSLLNAYSGCLDDAADQIALAQEKQIDIRGPLKTMQSKGKEFLETLNKLNEGGPEYDAYKETLQDAIEGTKDALSDAEKAAKELTPAPVRRKPS
jgi:chromosome segregation ATPase